MVAVINTGGGSGGGGGATDFSGLTGQATLAQLPTLAANRLLGNPSGSTSVPSAITLAASLLFAAGALTTAPFTGDVIASQGSVVTTVAAIQGTTVAGVTGTGNVVFSVAPTFTGTGPCATISAASNTANVGALLITGNTANPFVDAHKTSIHLVAEDGGLAEIMFDTFGARNILNFRYSGGTAAAPAFTPTAAEIFRIGARGYGTTILTNTSAGIGAITAENFTDAANGTFLVLRTTAIGAAGNANGGTEAWRAQPSGGGSIGDSTYNATDRGNGVLALKTGLMVGTTTENFPASGNIVGTTDAQTLTNKTIAGGSNTISGIALTSLASIANNTLLGNSSGSSAAPAAQTLGATLAFASGALQTTAGTGDVAWSANSFVTTIAANFPRLDAAANAFTGTITVSNGATLPSPVLSGGVQIAGGNAVAASFELDSFNATGNVVLRRAQTSSATPGAITSALNLTKIIWQGYNGTSYVAAATISATSTATTYDSTHHGAFLSLLTSPDVGAIAEGVRIQGSGGVTIGGTLTTDPAAGGLAVGVAAGIGTNAITTAFLALAAGTTAKSQINLPTGGPPTSPNDGDLWREDNTNTGVKIRINGVTKSVTVA